MNCCNRKRSGILVGEEGEGGRVFLCLGRAAPCVGLKARRAGSGRVAALGVPAIRPWISVVRSDGLCPKALDPWMCPLVSFVHSTVWDGMGWTGFGSWMCTFRVSVLLPGLG
jgi:hypothetical protein